MASDREIVTTRIIGKTRLTFQQRFDTAAECDKVKKFAGEANEPNLDRLEAELAGRSHE